MSCELCGHFSREGVELHHMLCIHVRRLQKRVEELEQRLAVAEQQVAYAAAWHEPMR